MYYVYFLASESGTLYVGVTSNLIRRVEEHRLGVVDGFSKKYACKKLIYYEQTEDVISAIAREKQIKNWRRDKKEHLVKGFNPQWKDLSDSL